MLPERKQPEKVSNKPLKNVRDWRQTMRRRFLTSRRKHRGEFKMSQNA